MAYRVFEEVSDTRPMPTGFASGFNPIIPTEEQVKAVKQKQEQDRVAAAIKSPELSFKAATDLEREWIAPQIQDATQSFVQSYVTDNKPSEEALAKVNTVKANIEKGYTNLALAKTVQETYSKIPELTDAVSVEVGAYNTTDPRNKPSGQEFVASIDQKLPQLYNLNIAASNFTKSLAENETQTTTTADINGNLSSSKFSIKSKIKDGKVTPEVITQFYQKSPLVEKAIDYRRQVDDIEKVNNLNTQIGVTAIQNTDGSYNYVMKKYNSTKELGDAVSKGLAYPTDANGNPLKGFESGFDIQERNNQIASNYIMGASGISTIKETKFKTDEEKTPKNSFLGNRTLNPDVSLEQSTIQSDNADGSLLINALITGQDLPNAQYDNRPFIATSINTKEGVQPVVIKNSTFKLANNGGNITGSLNVNGFTPVFFDTEGKVVVLPNNFTEKEKLDYLATKKGLKQGLLMVGVVDKGTGEDAKQVVVEVQNPTDPNFVNFNKRTTNKQKPKDVFNGFLKQNPDAVYLKKAEDVKAFGAEPKKKTAPVAANKPKVKTPVLDVTQ
jgi:hypothetical protein